MYVVAYAYIGTMRLLGRGAFFMLGLGVEESSALIHLCTARLATVRISLFQIQK